MEVKIYFNDNDIVVCEKIPEMSSETGIQNSFPDMLAKMLSEEGKMELFTVHRLDNGVGGIMVYAKNSKSAASLSKQISDGSFKKEYCAYVSGTPEESTGTLHDFLFKDSSKNKVFCVKSPRKGVKEAVLFYNVTGCFDTAEGPVSRVNIQLQTGRTHQIRVQFAGRKMPVLGDRKYGSKIKTDKIMLRSVALEFMHPATGEKLRFEDVGKLDEDFTRFSRETEEK